MGGKRVAASGATPWSKEDARDELFLYQHKWVGEAQKSHGVKFEDLEKLRHHAIDDGLIPTYVIERENGRLYFLIEEQQFNEFKQVITDV